MRAVLTQVRVAVLRRRAQTATVLLISLLAGSVATMALTLLVRSHQPWDDAAARYSTAHLIFHFDAERVTAQQLEATVSLPGVIAAGPPHDTALVPFESGAQKGTLELIGRGDPGGLVDRLPLAAGRWPARSGEIAVTRTEDSSIPIQPRLGETIRALTGRGTFAFTVVGEVIDLGGHGFEIDFANGAPGAWVLPADIAQFIDGSQIRLGYEMAYRFEHASNTDELAIDRREIEAALPAGSQSQPVEDWLTMREGSTWFIVLISSIIVSFTIFALLAVTVIVGSVVAGSVLSSYREIGIAKALGFTPGQVLVVSAGQMLVPALAGAVLGVPVGALASRPFLDDAARSLQLPAPSIFDPVVMTTVPAALAVIVLLAALVPSLRAAATDPARAMALGTAPRSTRRSRLAAVLTRLRAPRPLSLGAGESFARPVRALLTLTALAIGIATATFAVGFQETLIALLVNDRAAYGYGQDVVVDRYSAVTDDQVTARMAEQPETRLIVGVKRLSVRTPGRTDTVALYAMRGDAPSLGFAAVQGRWFQAPGEAVIGAIVARDAHVGIGDTLNAVMVGGPTIAMRVVGVMNDFNTGGRAIRVGWGTLAAVMPGVAPDEYLVRLAPGADGHDYAARIAALSPDFLQARATSIADISIYSNLITWMISALALVLLMIAGAGVFNATWLTTRERIRDVAVLKSVGMTAGQIAWMTIASVLVLAIAGTFVGLPVGIWLESVIWDGIASTFGLVVNLASGVSALAIGLAILTALVIAVLGAAWPARWAAATPVAGVLRSE